MTKLITIDYATLEQLVEFVEFHSKYWNGQGAHPMTVVTAGRAALSRAERKAEREHLANEPTGPLGVRTGPMEWSKP